LSTIEAATASLSVPVKKLSFFLAQYMALKAAESLHEQLRSHPEGFSQYIDSDVNDAEKEQVLLDITAKMRNADKVQALLTALDPNKHEGAQWLTGMEPLEDAYNALTRKTDPKNRSSKPWSDFVGIALNKSTDQSVASEVEASAERLIQESVNAISIGWVEAMKRYQEEGGAGRLGLLEAVAVATCARVWSSQPRIFPSRPQQSPAALASTWAESARMSPSVTPRRFAATSLIFTEQRWSRRSKSHSFDSRS